MGFVLTVIGLLLLIVSLAGVVLGLYMAADSRTRARGRLFALLWVPGLAASSGVLMRDGVTFMVGTVCLLIAGAVFVFEGDRSHEYPANTKRDLARGPAGDRLVDSEKPTRENEAQGKAQGKAQGSGRVAS